MFQLDWNLTETSTSGWNNNIKSELVKYFHYFAWTKAKEVQVWSVNEGVAGFRGWRDGSCCAWWEFWKFRVPSLWWCQAAFLAAASISTGCKFYFTSNPSDKTPICFFVFCLCAFSRCFVYIFFIFFNCGRVEGSGLIYSTCGGVSFNLYKKTLFFWLMLLS